MLPAPGSPTFIPSLLQHLQSEIQGSGHEWTIDPSLFSALLLAQIVGPGRGGVIVDVLPSEGKKKGVEKVVGNVIVLTQGVYGLSTLHLRLDSHSQPSDISHALISGQGNSSRRNNSARTPTSPSSSRYYTPGLPTPLFPRSTRTSRTTTPGITPKNSRPLLAPPVKGNTDEYGFGPFLPIQPGYPDNDHDDHLNQDDGHGQHQIPHCLVISGLERASSAVWTRLVDILLRGYVEVPCTDSVSKDKGEQGLVKGAPGDNGGDEGRTRRWELPDGFGVIWVRDEDKSEDCYSWLIDQFSCSITVHPDDLVTTPDLPPRSLIPRTYISTLHSLLPFTHISPHLITHTSNLLSALSNHPRLHSCITGKVLLLLPDFIRAHRLLSAPFDLPVGWEEGLNRREIILQGRKVGEKRKEGDLGVGGGVGGVDTWGIMAGEEPLISALQHGDAIGIDRTIQGERQPDSVEDNTNQAGMEEWYCHPANLDAVVNLCLRHRLSWREEGGEVMWLLTGTARGHLDKVGGVNGLGRMDEGEGKRKDKKKGRRRRRGVDMIIEEIMGLV